MLSEIDRVDHQRRKAAVAAGVGDDLPGEGEEQPRALDHGDRPERLGRKVGKAENAGIDQLDGEERVVAVDGLGIDLEFDLVVVALDRVATGR